MTESDCICIATQINWGDDEIAVYATNGERAKWPADVAQPASESEPNEKWEKMLGLH